jgi:outer membrane protein
VYQLIGGKITNFYAIVFFIWELFHKFAVRKKHIYMKRIILMIIACVTLTVQAQESMTLIKIGYLSYDSALRAMPDYALTQQRLTNLKSQYEAELKRVEQEFNQKYEAFLEGQKDFPKTILYKRQTELKELMERNVNFKNNSLRELAEAEQTAMAPLREKLNTLLADVAREQGFIIILNTDADACPYIAPSLSEDINALVKQKLQQ